MAGSLFEIEAWRLADDSVKNTIDEDGLGGSSRTSNSTSRTLSYSLADVIVLSICMGPRAAASIVAGTSGAVNATRAKIQR